MDMWHKIRPQLKPNLESNWIRTPIEIHIRIKKKKFRTLAFNIYIYIYIYIDDSDKEDLFRILESISSLSLSSIFNILSSLFSLPGFYLK